MVILDYPIAFGLLPQWLQDSGHPVVANACAREVAASGFALNLVPETEAARRIDAGERVYTSSEASLAWLKEHTKNDELDRAIELCKDKAALREALAPMEPELVYRRCTTNEIPTLDYEELPVPFVLKPVRGFCSVGVFLVRNRTEWQQAVDAVRRDAIESVYSQDVVDTADYVLESFIDGTEYALDLYYDGRGRAHVLNVLRHDFASEDDTSDRLYLTSPAIVAAMRPMFEQWFNRANEYLRFKGFCIHAEMRVDGDKARPIEFNPLRFAGVGGTDICRYAYGYYTYEAYLTDRVPDDAVYRAAAGKVFAMSFIVPTAGLEHRRFDIERFGGQLDHVLDMRPFDVAQTGAWAFVFCWEPEEQADRLKALVTADLSAYVLPDADEEEPVFRKMRRAKQELSREECEEVLRRGSYGVLACAGDGGYPYAVPVNYIWHYGTLYFHSANAGHKVDAIARNAKVSFCVVDKSDLVPAEFTTYFRSVIAFGRARLVDDPDEAFEALEALTVGLAQDMDAEKTRRELEKCKRRATLAMIAVDIDHLTGKESIELVRRQAPGDTK